MTAIIQLNDASKIYGTGDKGTAALRGVSLAVSQGESLAIIGKSGSGKSTLMHILSTLDRPTTGELLIDGQSTQAFSESKLAELRNEKFGFVFQQFFLNARDTCLENVILPLMIGGKGKSEREQKGRAILEAVGLSDKVESKANDLSGGQKQRLCIARALITEPQVVFADEPTGNLDSENGQMVVDLLFRLQKEKGITLIMVTHDHELAALCQRRITIKDGQIVESN